MGLEKCSPSICTLVIREAIAEAKDNDTPLFISFMDSSKAFDIVYHTILLIALHDLQLEPHLWHLYNDMYMTVLSQVRVNGQLSHKFKEGRGIRKGGETSPDGFKVKENMFLNRIHPESLHIGATPVGIPTVADGNCMLSSSHNAAQTQLLMAQANTAKICCVFSSTKTKVMYTADKQTKNIKHKPPLQFCRSTIEYTNQETHLGLVRTSDGKVTKAVKSCIQTGRRASDKLMGAGLTG